jgi:hypothetical protein
MSQALLEPTARGAGARPQADPSATRAGFVLTALGVACTAALLAGWVPLRFSIVTVFLFAGPHNWLEFRYFLTRLPARWGRLTTFFAVGFAGMIGITAAFAALLHLTEIGWLNNEQFQHSYAALGTVLVLWIAALVHLRSRQNPRRDWGWIWPVSLLAIALAWLNPSLWWLGLVYLHPVMAFWLLDRELKRSRPEWRSAFHLCLAALPIFLGALWWRLAGAPSLAVSSELDQRITDHAGATVLQGMVSSHLLVATHTFLEMLHYGVWVVAIPLIGLRAAPWRLSRVPLARRGVAWHRGVVTFLAAGLAVVLVLWIGFCVDYTTTRTVYFTLALVHVFAEVPFLLRAL